MQHLTGHNSKSPSCIPIVNLGVLLLCAPLAAPYLHDDAISLEDDHAGPDVALIPAITECPHTQAAESHGLECVL